MDVQSFEWSVGWLANEDARSATITTTSTKPAGPFIRNANLCPLLAADAAKSHPDKTNSEETDKIDTISLFEAYIFLFNLAMPFVCRPKNNNNNNNNKDNKSWPIQTLR